MNLDRELEYMHRKGTMFAQALAGEVVGWFEYDTLLSAYDHVYDEPSPTEKRAYRPVIVMSVLYVNVEEAARVNDPSGRRVTNSLAIGVSVRTLRDSGLSNPQDNRRHLNDLLMYQQRLWAVDSYEVRGRVARDSVMVGVVASELQPDESPFDDLPTIGEAELYSRPMGFPSSRYNDQSFNHHELPAYHDNDGVWDQSFWDFFDWSVGNEP